MSRLLALIGAIVLFAGPVLGAGEKKRALVDAIFKTFDQVVQKREPVGHP